ncbi:uncharacterized protein LOC124692417 isoform X2 [Lolium rigidum]|uniref:uncharacterized protein LOC124692417 isoform X2 n=1 Tax=Lolium rigidum TaxID=89674 RepID=UPI001F5DE6D0|nr:uncharacterized protein LOC124692417 isoform X2 [Lolium rigidum]
MIWTTSSTKHFNVWNKWMCSWLEGSHRRWIRLAVVAFFFDSAGNKWMCSWLEGSHGRWIQPAGSCGPLLRLGGFRQGRLLQASSCAALAGPPRPSLTTFE